jgi:cytochrome c-type biogenesis protein CcmF
MEYTGEHLLPGKLGHFFLLLSLIASIAATFSYFKATTSKLPEDSTYWKRLARIFFIAESVSVFAIFGILLFLLSNHYFEYKYVWQHSSRSLEPKYLLSCVWEGQEGSFLLWSIWHCVIGLVFIWREKKWEAPVMTVVSFTQFCLATMVIGIPLFGVKIGQNPFILLRNSGILNDPGFYDLNGILRSDYLKFITDGNDLNVLLQNYWMVIHPPVLFLGFASTIIPFSFAIAGLWTKDFTGWAKAALPWALFAAAVFGLGIMMGAKWAYESLNFGGYWAWDPVENASLVPWLVLIAGLHTLLIFRHTGNALRSTHLFFILSFGLVLYSTYLTRSGVLQDTSVHAFTLDADGEDWFLIMQFMLLPIIIGIPALVLFAARYKKIPYIVKEEETSSREFWMFIGSLVFFLSALLIIGMTSVPVFNKFASFVLGKDTEVFKALAFGADTVHAYNRIQIFVAIIIGFLSGFGMYLKYKNTGKSFLKKLIVPSIIGLVLATLVVAFGDINYTEKGPAYLGAVWLAIAASIYAIITNAMYIWTGLRGSMIRAGGTLSHVGFGLMMLGVLLSSSKKEVLSLNRSGIFVPFGSESQEKPGENLTLVQGVRTDMDTYWVTYRSDSSHPKKKQVFYHLDFESKDGKDKFTLAPNAFINPKGQQGLSANPDARHYWDYDVFTYISSIVNTDNVEDTSKFRTESLKLGDTLWYSKGFAVLDSIRSHKNIPNPQFAPDDSITVATMKVFAKTSSIYTSKPMLFNMRGNLFPQPDTLISEGLVLQVQKAEGDQLEIGYKESDAILKYVTLKAYKFPYIAILWIGTMIMILGIGLSMVRRIQTNRIKTKN